MSKKLRIKNFTGFTLIPRHHSGFTLIELLVVVSVIGLLASVIMVSLNSARVKARDSRRVADLRQMTIALELYFDDHGYYPPSNCGWDCNDYRYQYDANSWNALAADLSPYMQLPKDPLNNAACPPWSAGCYTYAYGNVGRNTQRVQYDLTAQLEGTSNPLRCAVKQYGFYFDNQPWCGPYSSQIYEASN